MALATVGSLFVVGVLVHNAEEVLLLPAWSQHTSKWYGAVSPKHFAFGAMVLSALLLVFGLGALLAGPASVWAYLFSGYVFAMAANALVPHLVATIATRTYMPGTATGLLLNAPFGIWFLVQAIASGFVTLDTLLWVAPVVAISLALSVPALFWLARALFPNSPSATGQGAA